MEKLIPVTLFTGFLGSGKTTIINDIIKQNPEIRFGFIINEFGEEGIDGSLIQSRKDDIIEMSNGCLCCIVQTDLVTAAKNLINTGKVDYLIVEASGLAEPLSIIQTFTTYSLGGILNFDATICIVDALNFKVTNENYRISKEQIYLADVIILNKVQLQEKSVVDFIVTYIREVNPYCTVVLNVENTLDSKLIIDTGKWTKENFDSKNVEEDEHEHDHNHIDEIVYSNTKLFDIDKLELWLENNFPETCIRAKGFVNIPDEKGERMTLLLQSVGNQRSLTNFENKFSNVDNSKSRLVFIGDDLDQEKIFSELDTLMIV